MASARTPNGSFLGSLSSLSAPQLGAIAIDGAFKRCSIKKDQVDEVYVGEVVQAGVGQAPARQAAILASIPNTVACMTVNKVCGSSMATVILGARSIKSGDAQVVVAAGMESMSNAPFLLPQMRGGHKFGEAITRDALQWDGLWDVYSNRSMGECAEECARHYKLSREEQDQYAITSFKRSQEAIKNGSFKAEIEPVVIKNKKGDVTISEDEGPFKANFEKIPTLKPSFDAKGTITAANASSINDGGAAIILAGENFKSQAKFKLSAWASHAHDPTWFTTAPLEAMKKCALKGKVDLKDIDLFEINEAFAIVPLVAMKELQLSPDKVNIYGGGIGLGHPIGQSGARVITTLMSALTQKNKRLGMASLCIGGGEALAVIIERL